MIGAFDKRVIIELSSDVLKEIARKYENIQKDVGGMMRGELSIEKVAKYSGLTVEEVEELAKLQTV